jgi:hypothetical protein
VEKIKKNEKTNESAKESKKKQALPLLGWAIEREKEMGSCSLLHAVSSKYSLAGRKATWAIQIHPPPIENGCYSFTQEMGLLLLKKKKQEMGLLPDEIV